MVITSPRYVFYRRGAIGTSRDPGNGSVLRDPKLRVVHAIPELYIYIYIYIDPFEKKVLFERAITVCGDETAIYVTGIIRFHMICRGRKNKKIKNNFLLPFTFAGEK